MGKAAGPTGVVSKAFGGFGTRWMTDLIKGMYEC